MKLYAPFGVLPVNDNFQDVVTNEYQPSYHSYSIKDTLQQLTHYPQRCEEIQKLCTSIDLPEVFPSWWTRYIGYVPQPLNYLLSNLTYEEFKTGQINDKVWKGFRDSLRDKRNDFPQSPKLGGILAPYTDLAREFNRRGSSANTEYELVIGHTPLEFLYMSNGDGWRSCQHLRDGSSNENIVGNFFETSSALVYVKPKNVGIDDEAGSIVARTIIRYMETSDKEPFIVASRVYGNDETVQQTMLTILHQHCKSHSMTFGVEGVYGNYQIFGRRHPVNVKSLPFSIPENMETPYMDGFNMETVKRLGEATIYRVTGTAYVDKSSVPEQSYELLDLSEVQA